MSLKHDLAAAAAAARARRPPEQQQVLEQALAGVRLLGITASALTVGEMAPEFDLPDHAGMRFSLTRALDRGPVVLLFYRGAWCPYCRLALGAFDRARGAIEAAGASIVAVSGEGPGAPAAAALAALTLRRLFDHDHRVARLFDLVYPLPASLIAHYRRIDFEVASLGSSGRWELPLPATYVIAPDGTVAFAHVEADFTTRAEPEEVLAALARL